MNRSRFDSTAGSWSLWLIAFLLVEFVFLAGGCDRTNGPDSKGTIDDPHSGQVASVDLTADPLLLANRLLEQGEVEAAAKEVQRALIATPGNGRATLLAAKVEVARGNTRLAIDIAASVDPGSDQAKDAAELQYVESLRLRDGRSAERALERLQNLEPNTQRWKNERWLLLNRLGRRQEACEVADEFCRAGVANEQHLLSLIQRTASFPLTLPANREPERIFFPGLGLARWHFTNNERHEALGVLEQYFSQELAGDADPSALALYGRLLAETQSHDRVAAWHARCDASVQNQGDYWAALGLLLFQQGKPTAAARALLEAVYRNPTDRICIQRLGQVFDSLGRAEDAAQFHNFGIEIANTDSVAKTIAANPANTAARTALSQKLLNLYRPYESLQWAQSSLPPDASRQRAVMQQQRQQLLQNPLTLTMAYEAAMMGLEREDFALDAVIDEVFGRLADVTKQNKLAAETRIIAKPQFVDVAKSVGVDFQWFHDLEIDLKSIPIYQSVGGGIAVLDYDLDGWPDIYFAQGSGKPPKQRSTRSNQLMRNLGVQSIGGQFTDTTVFASAEDWNYSSGQAAGDINQDGFPDLFVGNLGRNRLLINNGDGTFRDATSDLGDPADSFTTSVAIADLNGDALPDLFECNYIEMEGGFAGPKIGPDGLDVQTSPLEHFAAADRWFKNQGNGSFAVEAIGETVAPPGTSLGLIVTDFDGDHRNDVLVGNDERANHLLIRDSNGGFRNVADALGCAYGFEGAATGCMGIASGDFNRDGRLDFHVTNFLKEPSNLYLQNSFGGFQDAAIQYKLDAVGRPYVGFGTKAIDIDRNGWLDLAITNGHIFDMRRFDQPFKMRPQMLMSLGHYFDEVDVEDPSGYWRGEYLGRAMSQIDFDRDGAMDLLIGHLDAPTALLRNETQTPGNWLQLEFVGSTSERDAIGVKVVIDCITGSYSHWVTAGDGYFSSDEPVIDLGLGVEATIQKLTIDWPSGHRQTFESPAANRRYLIIENEDQLFDRLEIEPR